METLAYLESLRDAAAPATAAALQHYRAMNAYGQVTRESYANGVSTVRTIDRNSGRLTGIDTAKGATTLQDNVYAWQSNGILKSRMRGSGMSARTERFTYDALDRLRSAVTQLAGSSTAARMLSMTYDRLGNLKSKSSSVTGDIGASAYTYGNGMSGQPALTELASVSIGGVSHSLTHDAWGRVTRYDRSGTATEDRYIGWNARHLPTTVTVGDSLTDSTPKAKDEFLYGPDGQRYYKKSTWEVPGADPMTPPTYSVEHTYYAGTHREVVRVGDTTNLSVATSTVSAAVLHVKTTPITGTATTALEYLHRDHLGSVESVTGAAGTELKVQAYDPFGSRRASDWTRALSGTERAALAAEAPQRTARGYTGHEHLERTGLIHMNGRVYDPAIGQFLSPDPVVADASFSQGWNAYSYALNSPLSYSDPSGLTLVGGCPPSLCGGGGRGGFAPSSVLASSSHVVRSVQYTLSVSFGGWKSFGFPTVDTGNPLILNISNAGGARRASSPESAPHRRRADYGSRIRLTLWVTAQTHSVGVTAPVDIGGDEQSPADLPMGALTSAALDIAQAVIGLAGLIPVLGNVADGINAGISVGRGNYQEAILDGASAVPGAGHATGAVMAGIRGKRAVSAIVKAATGRADEIDSARIYRQGTSRESPPRLNRQAQAAESSSIGIHGVSGSTTTLRGACSSASCADLEAAGFKVHRTPTRRNPNHVTIELPKPVTRETANIFNDTFGR